MRELSLWQSGARSRRSGRQAVRQAGIQLQVGRAASGIAAPQKPHFSPHVPPTGVEGSIHYYRNLPLHCPGTGAQCHSPAGTPCTAPSKCAGSCSSRPGQKGAEGRRALKCHALTMEMLECHGAGSKPLPPSHPPTCGGAPTARHPRRTCPAGAPERSGAAAGGSQGASTAGIEMGSTSAVGLR